MTPAHNRWCQHFFYFQPTLNRLFNNCIELYINLKLDEGEGGQLPSRPQQKILSKSPAKKPKYLVRPDITQKAYLEHYQISMMEHSSKNVPPSMFGRVVNASLTPFKIFTNS